MGSIKAWLHRPWDRCVAGHRMGTKQGYELCRKHGIRRLTGKQLKRLRDSNRSYEDYVDENGYG